MLEPSLCERFAAPSAGGLKRGGGEELSTFGPGVRVCLLAGQVSVILGRLSVRQSSMDEGRGGVGHVGKPRGLAAPAYARMNEKSL